MAPGGACRLYKLFNWLDPLMNFSVRPCEVKPFARRTPRSNWLCKENEHQQNLFQCHQRFMAQFSLWRHKVQLVLIKMGILSSNNLDCIGCSSMREGVWGQTLQKMDCLGRSSLLGFHTSVSGIKEAGCDRGPCALYQSCCTQEQESESERCLKILPVC